MKIMTLNTIQTMETSKLKKIYDDLNFDSAFEDEEKVNWELLAMISDELRERK